jgi:hypothetical protein
MTGPEPHPRRAEDQLTHAGFHYQASSRSRNDREIQEPERTA